MVNQLGIMILGGYTPRVDRNMLAGTVTVDGLPAKRLVVIFDRRSLTYVASTFSDPVNGTWKIKGVSEHPLRSLLALSFDNTGHYNAEVADYISQVATIL